jgi:heptosyltransferase II
MKSENQFKVWDKNELPKKILAIRLQALGDTFIALSYLQYLRENLPSSTIIDFVVRDEFKNIPNNLILFNHVYIIKGGNPIKKQLFSALGYFFKIRKQKYDVVLDLQNNEVSKLIRKVANPFCFVEFDRYSPLHACKRNINTINQAGFIKIAEGYQFKFKNPDYGKTRLDKLVSDNEKLILLNPAGAYENRNWPLQNYIDLAKQFQIHFQNKVKFLFLGVSKIQEKVDEIKKHLKDSAIDMITKTSEIEAFNIIQQIDLCITEDGALMHMAYLSKKPTVILLGSSRSDWLDPKLPHTFCFNSNDLACGNCMQAICKLGTNECLTRIKPEQVFNQSITLLNLIAHD